MPVARRVSAAVVRPLRTAVLRGWTDRFATYDQDETVAVHVAAFQDGAESPDGVGTIYPEAPPDENRDEIPAAAYAPDASWRLRGMATSDAARGTGLGRLVLDECFEVVRQSRRAVPVVQRPHRRRPVLPPARDGGGRAGVRHPGHRAALRDVGRSSELEVRSSEFGHKTLTR